MAVKVHEFFSIYKRQTVSFFVLIQILSAILAGCVAWLLWQGLNAEPLLAFAVAVAALAIFNVIMTALLFKIASEPLQKLTQAIAHVSKDPVVTPPPNLNAKRFEVSGLKAMVQTIYELAVNVPGNAAIDPANNDTKVAFLRNLADQLPCGLVALASDGRVLYSNKLAPVRTTPDDGEQLSLNFEQNDTFDKWLADCKANKVRDTHLWLRVADRLPGEEGRRIFDVVAYYQKNDESDLQVILVALDRTGVYARDQDDMDFIALAAHELRGPITVIRGYLDVLNQEFGGTLGPDQQVLIDRLQVSAERLSGYINNILNVSRYDRKQFKVHMQQEQFIEIIKSLLPDIALRAKTQSRSLEFHIPPDLPAVAVDRSSISEVITNLIDNAIKYSHQGGKVVVAANVKGDFVEVTVTDSGIGMPEAVVGNLFNKFYRSHRSREAVGGTGLGLYICKAIVESHGGSIWVRSIEGEGSTFGFTIPIYATVASKLANGDNSNNDITQRPEGWIKNHAMYRR